MSILKEPTKVFVFSSILFNENEITFENLKTIWANQFSLDSYAYHDYCPMKEYYSKEMGEIAHLKRYFFFSHNLYPRSVLVDGKKWAIEQENQFKTKDSRKINIDIGTISLENLQLATGKNFTHRIFLRDNIYSDLTLLFQNDSYHTLPWTYPDYAHPEIINIFNLKRRVLQVKLEN